ncbi:hypothetical protein L873DRAFT_1658498, partial [Choiromyces venosus 120613-1]
MHLLSAATLTIPLFAILSLAADAPKQTGENPITYPLKGDMVDASRPVNITWKATTK